MIKKLLAPALLASVISASPAHAQSAPVMSEEEVFAFVRVAMPGALRSLQEKCRTTLTADDYIYTSGDDLYARLQTASNEAWPEAVDLIARASSAENPAMAELMAGMPPEVLRPFVDEMIAGMVNQRVESKTCPQINRALELLDPLPTENLADLIGFAYAESQKAKDDEDEPAVAEKGRTE